MDPIQLRLMGYPQVMVGSQEVGDQLSLKALALLVYLSIEGGQHTRLELAGLLWGEMDDARARANLRSTLHNLRQVLPNLITVSRNAVSIPPSAPIELDTHLLQNLASQPEQFACSSFYEQITASHRGEFLEGFFVESAPDFEAWLVQEREHHRLVYLQCLERVAAAVTSRGEWSQAIELTREILTIEPWLESAQRRLMLLLARSGHCNQALAQFESCRVLLDEELQVPPEPETWQIYEMIKSAAYCPRHNLPAFPTSFIGRRAELHTLQRWLRDPDCRLITIAGFGGLGKTRLAVELARRAVQRDQRLFLHGAYYLPLPERLSAAQFLPVLAQGIGMTLSEHGSPQAQVLQYFRDKEMLLVIDAPQAELVETQILADILRQVPGIKFVVISPVRLRLHWEWFFPLEGLSHPALDHLPHSLPELRQYEAGQLFLENARRVPYRFSGPHSIAAVGKICALVEGMPLAVELAAARLRAFSAAAIARELQHSLDILQAEFVDLPDRHRDLARLLASSWDQLTPRLQTALIRLASLPEFNGESAREIGGLQMDDLETLIDGAFVRKPASGVYKIPALLRRYAHQQASVSNTARLAGELIGVF